MDYLFGAMKSSVGKDFKASIFENDFQFSFLVFFWLPEIMVIEL